jgi:hypothetical protein
MVVMRPSDLVHRDYMRRNGGTATGDQLSHCAMRCAAPATRNAGTKIESKGAGRPGWLTPASAAKTAGAAPAQAGGVTGGFVCCKHWLDCQPTARTERE